MLVWRHGIRLLDPAQTCPLWTSNPDASHTEGQSDPEEEESIVCTSNDLPRCTICRMSADMLHCLKDLEQIKEVSTALQRRIRDFVDILAKF
ncbi:hypothetical protein AB205_0173660 [Aquarana catesbeiana]|nr:hypothetical protein AB205_0173660 [Aquarana catesbeiana]